MSGPLKFPSAEDHLAESIVMPLEGDRFPQRSGRLTRQGVRVLRSAVIERLQSYPYFALVRGCPGIKSKGELRRVAKSIGPFSQHFSFRRLLRGKPSAGSITEIKVDPTVKTVQNDGTKYSRTSCALELHTDGSFEQNPFDVVLLYCIESDGHLEELAIFGRWDVSRAVTGR